MMSGRSFDHMLGSLKAANPLIDGVDGTQWNPDTQGNQVFVQPLADFQGQLDVDPDHRFPGVDLQIFGGDQSPNRVANMQGFVKSYYRQRRDLGHSQKIMYYFTEDKLPVLTSLATNFAVFNRWFASIPGSTICNRAFAHYGTSFGQVGISSFYPRGKSIYERLQDAGRTAKFYYFDQQSSSLEIVNLLESQAQLFGTYNQFLADCKKGTLADYNYIEPNHTDHDDDDGFHIASDQHPDHHIQAGEIYIASVYSAIRENPALWASTALLVVYDQHGGIFDHVPPPACTPDGYSAGPADTGLNYSFHFDRLGVRVPAILVSPWVPKGTVVGENRVFEHASIPATVTNHFIGSYAQSTPREQNAQTFLDLLSLPTMRSDSIFFNGGGAPLKDLHPSSSIPPNNPPIAVSSLQGSSDREEDHAKQEETKRAPAKAEPTLPAKGRMRTAARPESAPSTSSAKTLQPNPTDQLGPSTHVARDHWTTEDSLGHYPFAYAIYRFLTDPETKSLLGVAIPCRFLRSGNLAVCIHEMTGNRCKQNSVSS
jgi:phospholipase C